MIIFIAHCTDRHIDDEIEVFTTLDGAKGFCLQFVKDNIRAPRDIKEDEIDGWEYHVHTGEEGPWARVIKSTLKKEIDILDDKLSLKSFALSVINRECPDCGKMDWFHKNNVRTCTNCGWSQDAKKETP